jgi:uncharacterized protein
VRKVPPAILRLAALLPVLLFAAASLWAADWKALKPQGYLSDFAGVVDAPSKAALENYAAEVERSTGAQMAFVTVNTLDGEPIEDVANDLFHGWGIGQKNKDNGVLFLLVTGDRRSRLEIGHGLEAILPDSLDGMLLVEMRPALRAGQYGEAMLSAAQSIGSIIAKDKGVAITASLPRRRAVEHPIHTIPWPLIIGAIVLFFLFTRGGRGGGGNFLTGMLLGSLMGGGGRRDGGGGWGGGFGGGDSGGGGFGGFGGGDSGGGGASSDW